MGFSTMCGQVIRIPTCKNGDPNMDVQNLLLLLAIRLNLPCRRLIVVAFA